MEVHTMQSSFPVRNSIDPKDAKYIPRISTILVASMEEAVASMEEAKDKISQVQYIFCDQLYPSIEDKMKCTNHIYAEAKRDSDDEWKLKESILLNQIKLLQNEKASVVSECNFLKQLKKEWCDMMSENESLLLKKDEQIEEEKEVQRKLCYLVAAKSSDVERKEKLLRRYKEKIEELRQKNVLLSSELEKKNKELTKRINMHSKLSEEVEIQNEKIARVGELLRDKENECQLLTVKVKQLQVSLDDLKAEVRRKDLQLYEQSEVQEKLAQKNEEHRLEIVKIRHELNGHEQVKKQLLSGIKVKEEHVEEFETDNNAGVSERSEQYKILTHQIDLRTSELQVEKEKRREAVTAFKKLKSQYNFLCKKFNLTPENMLLLKPKTEVNSQLDCDDMDDTSPETRDQTPHVGGGVIRNGNVTRESNFLIKNENIQEGNLDRHHEKSAARSSDQQQQQQHRISKSSLTIPSSPPPSSSKWKTTGNSISSSSKKRLAASSEWRETRSRQVPAGGGDPHDDFLDTPLEAIRGNLTKKPPPPPAREVVDGNNNITPPNPAVTKNNNGNNGENSSDDDETQDMNAEPVNHRLNQQQPNPPKRVDRKSFKFIEPIRKKAQRDNLKGIECKQCKKFYEAVLEDGSRRDGKDMVGGGGFRCEHHEGVSRHRYRYAPPLTPEGFWNIGFDSEV